MNKIFDPNNPIKLCISGMELEESGNSEDAITMFHKAWCTVLFYLDSINQSMENILG